MAKGISNRLSLIIPSNNSPPPYKVYKQRWQNISTSFQIHDLKKYIIVFFLTVNSIQKWMWVEKGVPGVSTCTVWQSEYPRFLICPFSHVVSLTTPTLCEVWKSAAIHSINPTLQLVSVLGPRGAINPHPPPKHTVHGINRHIKLENKSMAFEL